MDKLLLNTLKPCVHIAEFQRSIKLDYVHALRFAQCLDLIPFIIPA
jgi:hypothetical protein